MVEHWARLPREVLDAHLQEHLKTIWTSSEQQDLVKSVSAHCQVVGLDDLQINIFVYYNVYMKQNRIYFSLFACTISGRAGLNS